MRNCLGRSGEHRKGRRDRPQCWWAAGPGRTTSRRTGPHPAAQAPPVWRRRKVRWAQPRCRWAAEGPAGLAAVPEGPAGLAAVPEGPAGLAAVPEGPVGTAAVPVGGGGAWPGQPHRHPDRLEAAARPAGPGRTTSRRAERSSRRGRRAGGQAARRPEICRGNEQGRTSGGATSNANARQPKRAAARSRSQWNTQRSRAATTSATWTAFRAAPLRRLSPETTRTRPRLPSTA